MFIEFDQIMNKLKQNKIESKTIQDKETILINIKKTLNTLNKDN